jgi:predicted phosphoribosyltransferase/nucleotide-binding universal stress UspA family protein
MARAVRWPTAMETIRSILVATDFGPASERALETAVEMATRYDAKLTVLHVFEPPPYPYVGVMPAPLMAPTVEQVRAGEYERFNATLEFVGKRCKNSNGILREGSAWREILAAIEAEKPDLVVLGSHGRRGLPRFVIGSVAERVVRLAPIPVMTVHGAWFEDRLDAGRKLASALAAVRGSSPVVVAISRGGVVVGDVVAKALDGELDALFARTIVHHGRMLGALCEDGSSRLDPMALQASELGDAERKELLAAERHALNEDVSRVRGTASIGDLWRRTAVLVSDELVDPWPMMAAADAIERLGCERLIVATPVASDQAVAALEAAGREVIVSHRVRAYVDGGAGYRNFEAPSDQDVAARLRGRPSRAA